MPLPTRLDYPVIAVGDLHGQLRSLDLLLAKLRRHAVWPTARLVFLGDFVDRGEDVKGGIARVLELCQEKPGSTGVMGNHDLAFVRAAGLDGEPSERWTSRYLVAYDHHRTFTSYLGHGPRSHSQTGWRAELDLLREALPADHREFLTHLPWMAEASGHVFVHNGLSPKLQEPANIQLELLRQRKWHGYVNAVIGTNTHQNYNPEYPVWLGADKSLSDAPLAIEGRVIVSGHKQVRRPEVSAVRIRIDTSGGMAPPLTGCILTGPHAPPEFVFSE